MFSLCSDFSGFSWVPKNEHQSKWKIFYWLFEICRVFTSEFFIFFRDFVSFFQLIDSHGTDENGFNRLDFSLFWMFFSSEVHIFWFWINKWRSLFWVIWIYMVDPKFQIMVAIIFILWRTAVKCGLCDRITVADTQKTRCCSQDSIAEILKKNLVCLRVLSRTSKNLLI